MFETICPETSKSETVREYEFPASRTILEELAAAWWTQNWSQMADQMEPETRTGVTKKSFPKKTVRS